MSKSRKLIIIHDGIQIQIQLAKRISRLLNIGWTELSDVYQDLLLYPYTWILFETSKSESKNKMKILHKMVAMNILKNKQFFRK
jgi:hypothetical protein